MISSPQPPEDVTRNALHALWTFPSLVAAAFMVGWGAEAAQFYVSQGLALALLAWIQVSPEFAVEAVISWHRDVALMTANFTGALRLLTGLGWPMIWTVAAVSAWQRGHRNGLYKIHLEEEHSAEIVGLVPPLLYFLVIIAKGTLTVIDAAVLIVLYAGYLVVLNRIPPKEHEEIEDVSRVVRGVVGLPARLRYMTIIGLFTIGGTLLFMTAHPFLESMIALATVLGVSQFVFVQWVAPFLSEFPEFVTTFYWARGRGKAGMALMNMASSNIVQWTLLAAMIPIVYSMSLGHIEAVPIGEHRTELLLTWLQGVLGVILLANFNFQAHEAIGLWVLWAIQLVVPHWREEIIVPYALWLMFELISTMWRPGRLRAFYVFPSLWRLAGRRKSDAPPVGP